MHIMMRTLSGFLGMPECTYVIHTHVLGRIRVVYK